jgi:hypothetical protein
MTPIFNKIFAALAVLAASPALAGPLIQNGNFASTTFTTNDQFGTGFGGQGITGWAGDAGYNLFFFNGTGTTVSANTQYDNGAGTGSEKLWGTSTFTGSSPLGTNYVALDGDPTINNAGGGGISQTIAGLQAGTNYALSFQWGAGELQSRSGNTTEYLAVKLGNETIDTITLSNPADSFTGWYNVTMIFSATSASELLSFMSNGTPNGAPPIAVLTDISMVAAPEPASIALLAAGLGGLAVLRRRRASPNA